MDHRFYIRGRGDPGIVEIDRMRSYAGTRSDARGSAPVPFPLRRPAPRRSDRAEVEIAARAASGEPSINAPNPLIRLLDEELFKAS